MEIISLLLASLIILGYSTFYEQDDLGVKKTSIRSTVMSITSDKNLHGCVEQLAEQLFLTSNLIEINKPIAVGTFCRSRIFAVKIRQLQMYLASNYKKALLH
jgi:hypothetical protein